MACVRLLVQPLAVLRARVVALYLPSYAPQLLGVYEQIDRAVPPVFESLRPPRLSQVPVVVLVQP